MCRTRSLATTFPIVSASSCLVGLKREDGLVKGVVIRHDVREDILQAGQSGHDVKDVERRR